MLPSKVYEVLRWTIAIVLPAIGILITTLTKIWDWQNVPAEQISLTLDAIGLFLGAVFGISKIANDKKTN